MIGQTFCLATARTPIGTIAACASMCYTLRCAVMFCKTLAKGMKRKTYLSTELNEFTLRVHLLLSPWKILGGDRMNTQSNIFMRTTAIYLFMYLFIHLFIFTARRANNHSCFSTDVKGEISCTSLPPVELQYAAASH